MAKAGDAAFLKRDAAGRESCRKHFQLLHLNEMRALLRKFKLGDMQNAHTIANCDV
jgi:hypothetical protein